MIWLLALVVFLLPFALLGFAYLLMVYGGDR